MGNCVRLPGYKNRRKSIKDVQTVHKLSRSRNTGHRSLSETLSYPLRKRIRQIRNASAPTEQSIQRRKSDGGLLSAYEKKIIVDSWKHISTNHEQFGRDVYRRIFECEPGLKMMFSWRDIKSCDLEKNPIFCKQSSAIMGAIDNCVRTLDATEVMWESLVQLGKYHTKLSGYGFRPEHWMTFKLSILLSIAISCENYKTKKGFLQAWNTLVTFICDTMKYGYNEGMKLRYEKHQPQPLPVDVE